MTFVIYMHPDELRRYIGDYVALGIVTPEQAVEELKARSMWPRRLSFARTGPCPRFDGFLEMLRDGSLFGLDRATE